VILLLYKGLSSIFEPLINSFLLVTHSEGNDSYSIYQITGIYSNAKQNRCKKKSQGWEGVWLGLVRGKGGRGRDYVSPVMQEMRRHHFLAVSPEMITTDGESSR
jgi:hypothetical protein